MEQCFDNELKTSKGFVFVCTGGNWLQDESARSAQSAGDKGSHRSRGWRRLFVGGLF